MSKSIIIAGPCAVESREQLFATAQELCALWDFNDLDLRYFRAGVWKPRSEPGSFAGVGASALPFLQELQQQFQLQVCVEVSQPEQLDLCEKYDIKVVWIGSRTAVNPFDVQEIASAAKGRDLTVLVKNPMISDLKLWAGNVERFLNAGVKQVMAVHRGFADGGENVYRNAPGWDLAIDFKVRFPHLPLLCDPSHIAGERQYIAQLSQLALDYGFDGLMVETHIHPQTALSDANQQLTPSELIDLLHQMNFKNNISSPAEMKLTKQRNLINNIDTQISVLLKKRMMIVDAIAQIKSEHNLPVVQPEQWQKVVGRYKDDSLQDEEYQDFINKFLELLHQSSIKRQRK